MASSTDPKSISSGLSLPIWMRRIETKFDDSTSFSPPAHDESFFYIRYPVSSRNTDDKQLNVNKLNSALQNTAIAITEQQHTLGTKTSTIVAADIKTTTNITTASSALETKVDFSKHTEPCRKFIGEKFEPVVPIIKGQKKSQGTDDGFKHAACGNSILKVAQQVVSGRQFYNRGGLKVATIDEANADQDDTITPNEEQEMINSARGVMRRGSKSLPASPIGSPKTGRKAINYNPYFTTYSSGNSSVENRGWILSSLFGLQRETVYTKSTLSVTSQIDEDVEEANETNNNNTTNGNSAHGVIGMDTHKKSGQHPQITLKAKPSELREMNFWSPTSM